MSHLREIVRFELIRQLKRPLLWLFSALMLTLAVLSMRGGSGRSDEIFSNSPVDVAASAIIAGMLSLVVAAVLAGDAAARDVQARTDPLVYALPLGRTEYVLGRFLPGVLIHAGVLLAALFGLMLLPLAWDPAIAAPFRPGPYAFAFAVYMLPNALVAHALMFAAAQASRRVIAAWGVGALLFFLSLFIPEFIGGQLGHWSFARWFDPSGYATVRLFMDTWAPAQQNVLLLPFDAVIVRNRLLWLGVAVATMALVVARFRFRHHAPRARRGTVDDTAPLADTVRGTPPAATPAFGAQARLRQLAEVFRFSLVQIVTNRAVLLLLFGPILFFLAMPEALEHIGVPIEPMTSRIVLTLERAAIVTIAPVLMLAYFTGELMWSEREARMNAMADAAPVPDWVLMVGKLLALVPPLLVHQALLLLAAVGVQRALGYGATDYSLLLQDLFGIQLLNLVLFGALAVAVHALVNHKLVGHVVIAVVSVMRVRMRDFGIESNLFAYSAAPEWMHTDMTGYGGTIAPWLWHKVYWLGWALLLLALARVLWPRGAESALGARLALARRRLRRAVPLLAGAVTLVLVTGGFVFWNTYVLNEHRTTDEVTALRVAYERTYERFAASVQPVVAAMTLRVELQPARGSARIAGRYVARNAGATPIDTVLVATSLEVSTRDVRFDRAARRLLCDERLGHELWLLDEPLAPGDSLGMTFTVDHSPRGFGGPANPIQPDAAVIDYEEGDWLPRFGYQDSRELTVAAERRRHGLAPIEFPRLEDANRLRHDYAHANRSRLDIVVGTDTKHVAVAPGELRRTWDEGGRRWFRYTTDRPVRESWVIMSAPYARRSARWRDVDIEVLYHPAHAAAVEHVLRGARSSLEYYSEQFGAYPYRSLRFAERPGYGGGANAHPGFIDYDEGFALMDAERDPRAIDFVFAVTAHEVAHQWWGHQMTPAYVEGASLLAESLAWYGALGVVEHEFGAEHLDRTLAMLRESYLTPRARAGVPLLRAVDWFESYRKGPFAMHALREYVGEARVNDALHGMLERFTADGAPLPTSLDLYDALRSATPDSLHALLHDLFAANTYWELATDSARAEPVGGGRWRVTMDVRASKQVVDTAGVEIDVAMYDPIEIGVYGMDSENRAGYRGAPLHLERRRLGAGHQRIVVEVDGRPAFAGVDPRSLLIDTNDTDNVAEVTTPP